MSTVHDIEEMIPAPPKVRADFALRCKGDSMVNARIFDGDIVYIRSQQYVDNGQIAAVMIGDEATLKRYFLKGDKLILKAENPEMKPLEYVGAEMEQIRIIGKAVAVTSFYGLDKEM